MKEPQAIVDWKNCVKKAKIKLGIPTDKYVLIKGRLLKEAMKCYCSSGY
jgi:hypothetical protein